MKICWPRTILSLVGAGYIALQSTGFAVPIIGGSTGLPSPDQTITFNEIVLASGTPLTTQYSALGVTFSGVFYNPQPDPFPNISVPYAGNFSATGVPPVNLTNPFSIMFTQDVTDASFAMATRVGTSLFESYLNGVLVESFVAPTGFSSSNDFYGFTGSFFDEIRVTVTSQNGAAVFDNLRFNYASANGVPEAGTAVGLLGIGLLALGALHRRLG